MFFIDVQKLQLHTLIRKWHLCANDFIPNANISKNHLTPALPHEPKSRGSRGTMLTMNRGRDNRES